MSALMVLEIEDSFKVEDVMSAFERASASLIRQGDIFRGQFLNSGVEVVLTVFKKPADIVAENISDTWKVGFRSALHCSYQMLSESWKDIEIIMVFLDSLQCGKFVLTFQYESMYAIKDEFGYRVLDSMVVI